MLPAVGAAVLESPITPLVIDALIAPVAVWFYDSAAAIGVRGAIAGGAIGGSYLYSNREKLLKGSKFRLPLSEKFKNKLMDVDRDILGQKVLQELLHTPNKRTKTTNITPAKSRQSRYNGKARSNVNYAYHVLKKRKRKQKKQNVSRRARRK